MEKSDKKKNRKMQFRSDGRHTGTPHSPALPAQPNTTPALCCILTAMSPKCVAEEDQLPELWAHPAVRPQQPHSLGDTEAKQSTTAVDSLQNSLPSPQDSAQNVNESQTKQTPTPQWEKTPHSSPTSLAALPDAAPHARQNEEVRNSTRCAHSAMGGSRLGVLSTEK